MLFLFGFTLLTLLMAIYVIKRTILPLPVSVNWKMLFAGTILLSSQSAGIGFFLSSVFPSFRTETVMIVFGFLFSFIFILFICCLFVNVLAFLTGIFISVAWLVFAAFWLSVLSVWLATKQPSIHKMSWELGLREPVKIVQISDLHIGSGFTKEWLRRVVKKVNKRAPDMVVITGDLIDGRVQELSAQLEPLKDINAPIYMVYGNHEYYYGLKEWIPEFQKLGIQILENESVSVKGIILGGVGMPKAAAFGFKAPDIAETFKNMSPDKPRILLAHYPEVFNQAAANKVVLQLSGHTHGGQLFFPFNLPVRWANQGYVKGKYRQNESLLYVTTGTGLWGGLPMRLGTLPEIVEVILK